MKRESEDQRRFIGTFAPLSKFQRSFEINSTPPGSMVKMIQKQEFLGERKYNRISGTLYFTASNLSG